LKNIKHGPGIFVLGPFALCVVQLSFRLPNVSSEFYRMGKYATRRVIPAQAGIQWTTSKSFDDVPLQFIQPSLDPRLRGDDAIESAFTIAMKLRTHLLKNIIAF
jgi:hypothetical protein